MIHLTEKDHNLVLGQMESHWAAQILIQLKLILSNKVAYLVMVGKGLKDLVQTGNPHKIVTHLGQDLAEILLGGKDRMIQQELQEMQMGCQPERAQVTVWDQEIHMGLMEDSLENWVLHMDPMESFKEEEPLKRAQNMEWVQMEDLCQTMAWMAVLLEEMVQEMNMDRATILLVGHLWMNWQTMEERAHRRALAQTEGLWGDMGQVLTASQWEEWAQKVALEVNMESTMCLAQMEGRWGGQDPRDYSQMTPLSTVLVQMESLLAGLLRKMLLDKVLVQTPTENLTLTPLIEKAPYLAWDQMANHLADQIRTTLDWVLMGDLLEGRAKAEEMGMDLILA